MNLVDVNQFKRKVNATGSIASAVDSSAIYKLSPFHNLKSDTYVRKSEFKVKLQQTSERGVCSMAINLFDESDKAVIRESKMPYVHVAAVLIQISCLFDWAISEKMEGIFALMDTLFEDPEENVVRACNFRFVDGRAAGCFRMNFSICAEDAIKGRPLIPYIKVKGVNIREGLHGFSVSIGTIFSLNKTEFPSVPLKIKDEYMDIVGTDFLDKKSIDELTINEMTEAQTEMQALPNPVITCVSRGRKDPIKLRDYSIRSNSKKPIIYNGSSSERKRRDEERSIKHFEEEVWKSASRFSLDKRPVLASSSVRIREYCSEGSKSDDGIRELCSGERRVFGGRRGTGREFTGTSWADFRGRGTDGGSSSNNNKEDQIEGTNSSSKGSECGVQSELLHSSKIF
ncbi:movement protein [Zostera virus T]|uniref:Movement protein n=1 Tax=Zostera virus T TaxID=2562808 RepID=A0AAE6D345_9VIRU|nr:movement protein [Zostera virus T]QBS17026.1 movement protein [Zostera virus T]